MAYRDWPNQPIRRILADLQNEDPGETKAQLRRLRDDLGLQVVLTPEMTAKRDEWSELCLAGRGLRTAFFISGVAAQFATLEIGLTFAVPPPLWMLVRRAVVYSSTAGEALFGNDRASAFLLGAGSVITTLPVRVLPAAPGQDIAAANFGTFPGTMMLNGAATSRAGTFGSIFPGGSILGRETIAANLKCELVSPGGWLAVLGPTQTTDHVFRIQHSVAAAGISGHIEWALVEADYF